jgi:1,2-dihydroxy-3-keto-5-methylthiopentene dioxygenase
MAFLQYDDGRTVDDLPHIQDALAPLRVRVNHWPTACAVRSLLDQPALDEEEKERVLTCHDGYFDRLRDEFGYQARDLIVLHPEMEHLHQLLAKFDRCHTHDDDEVRYIVDGEGVFGFVLPDGGQLHLTVQPGEFINVPAGTEHWFYLTSLQRIKAVRYFTSTEGWVPVYTDTVIRPLAA